MQRKKIAAWAKLHEVEIVQWWEEIDQSGAKLERPMFQEALARCDRGETGGIVVARLDRFARSAVDALSSIRRMTDAGARLVSVEDNFDGSPPMGRFAIGILTLIAELEHYRMFGMDLNHGTDDGRPYPYEKPRAANREFVITFEEFMREVWRGVENSRNTSGANPTDDATIADLALALDEMLGTRRKNGNLNREELWYTSMMSWFHLSLSFDTPIVRSLRAEGDAPEERLMKIAAKVGLPSHARSHSYFRLADPISRILRFIEDSQFNTSGTAPALYEINPPPVNPIRDAMTEIVSHWSLATGRDMKARKVSVTPSTAVRQPPMPQPLRAAWRQAAGRSSAS